MASLAEKKAKDSFGTYMRPHTFGASNFPSRDLLHDKLAFFSTQRIIKA
jgi:hypothetical protein